MSKAKDGSVFQRFTLGPKADWTDKSQAHTYFMRWFVSEDGTVDQKVVAAAKKALGDSVLLLAVS